MYFITYTDEFSQAPVYSSLCSQNIMFFSACYSCTLGHVIIWGSPSLKIFLGIRHSACVCSQNTGWTELHFSFTAYYIATSKVGRSQGEIRHVPILSNTLFQKKSHVHSTSYSNWAVNAIIGQLEHQSLYLSGGGQGGGREECGLFEVMDVHTWTGSKADTLAIIYCLGMLNHHGSQ